MFGLSGFRKQAPFAQATDFRAYTARDLSSEANVSFSCPIRRQRSLTTSSPHVQMMDLEAVTH